ncbi:hypothetical protein [Brytella acorum]|uniref:Uncharacterized protein n=1 Tax=Brytella acorum TaxID=2959299 RepID=A0AA35VDH7_9PROT|nr:hypothetical protein [Brytella acorum]MDF3625769.1 hypothetical protein [Brytella acorum]CAI9121280.1 hypothetical protein LMG32879_002127 [Brytella acorum]
MSISTEAREIARLRKRATLAADFLEMDRAIRRVAGMEAKSHPEMRAKARLVLDYPFRPDLIVSLCHDALATGGHE